MKHRNRTLSSSFFVSSSIAAVAAAAVLLTAPAATAQDWPHWRGPHYNGSTTANDLPTDFTIKKHVKWTADLPGPGASTPIVVGDKIFLTSVDTKRERLVAMCFDRKDGKVLWKKDAGSGYTAGRGTRVARGSRTTYASPSATTDGKVVVFFFGNGDLVGFDYEGEKLWSRNIQKDYGNFAFNWTFAASPTLWEGKVFLPVLQRNVPIRQRRRGRRGGGGGGAAQGAPTKIDSFLLAVDPKTGKTIYKHVRPSQAQVESLESYTTTIPFVGEKSRKQLLVVGGDVLTAHDPATGEELWRWGTWNEGHRQRFWRLVPTVVVGGDVAMVCAPKGAPVYAVKLNGGEGDLDQDDYLAWKSEGRRNKVSSDVPTPAFHDGHFYVLGDGQSALSKVHAKTGMVI